MTSDPPEGLTNLPAYPVSALRHAATAPSERSAEAPSLARLARVIAEILVADAERRSREARSNPIDERAT